MVVRIVGRQSQPCNFSNLCPMDMNQQARFVEEIWQAFLSTQISFISHFWKIYSIIYATCLQIRLAYYKIDEDKDENTLLLLFSISYMRLVARWCQMRQRYRSKNDDDWHFDMVPTSQDSCTFGGCGTSTVDALVLHPENRQIGEWTEATIYGILVISLWEAFNGNLSWCF